MADWKEAEQYLEFIEKLYTELGTVGYPALVCVIRPLRDRFNAGERTGKLYEEIMSLE